MIVTPGRRAALPEFFLVVEMPAPLAELGHYLNAHKTVTRDAAVMVLKWWHENVLKKHFERSARQRYSHKPRTRGWEEYKRRVHGSVIDLVASGELRKRMLASRPKIKAYATESLVVAEMKYPLPYGTFGRGEGVDPQQMAIELSSWSDEDVRQATDEFLREVDYGLGDVWASAPLIKRIVGRRFGRSVFFH